MKKNHFIVGTGVMTLGLVFVCGCPTTVMDERQYRPAEETETPMVMETVEVEDVAATPAVEETTVVRKPAVTYAPMKGTWDNEGITSNVRKPAKARTIKTAPNGVYTVKSGDTLGAIAYAHGVSLNALLNANNLNMKSVIRPGQKIRIPGKDAKTATPAAVKAPAKAETPNTVGLLNADGTYTIKAGDNIPKIARKLGIKAKDLQQANNLSDEATTRLQIGQKLVVPGKSAAVQQPAPAVPADPAPVQPAQTDELESIINEASAETPAAAVPADAAAVPADAAATPAVTVPEEIFVEIENDITIEEFAKAHNVTVEDVRKSNQDAGAVLKKGELIFLPKK